MIACDPGRWSCAPWQETEQFNDSVNEELVNLFLIGYQDGASSKVMLPLPDFAQHVKAPFVLLLRCTTSLKTCHNRLDVDCCNHLQGDGESHTA